MLRKLSYAAMLVVLTLLCTQLTFAQSGLGASQAITTTANVYSQIVINGVTTAAFSNIAVDQNPFLDPTAAASTNVGASASAGTFVVNASSGSKILVTFAGQGTLSDGAGHTMKFTPSVTYNTTATQGTSTSYTTGVNKTLTGTTGYFWVGGTLFDGPTGLAVVPTGQTAGSYSTASGGGAAVTFSVDYVL
jgi:hypothetical protein